MPFDAQRSTKRTASVVKNGEDVFDVTKGAPQVILGMCTSCKPETRMKVEQKISELADRGIRSLGIARKLEGDERGWVWLGILTRPATTPRTPSKRPTRWALTSR